MSRKYRRWLKRAEAFERGEFDAKNTLGNQAYKVPLRYRKWYIMGYQNTKATRRTTNTTSTTSTEYLLHRILTAP